MKVIEKVLSDRNLTDACKEVVRNKGAAGVDGMGYKELKGYLDENREALKNVILDRQYIPQPIRGKELSGAISRIPLKKNNINS